MLKGKGLLSETQKEFLHFFAMLPDQEHFYLTGGTALAEFFLGHRYSYDIDLFTTEENLLTPFCRVLEQRAKRNRLALSTVRRFGSFVEYLMEASDSSFLIQIAVDTPYRFGGPLLSEHGVWVNDWDDLKVDKLLAFYGRAEPRDAIDLYFILEREPLDTLTSLAAQKDPSFDRYWFAVACQRVQAFPDALSEWPVQMVIPVDPIMVKQRFEQIALQIMRELHSERG